MVLDGLETTFVETSFAKIKEFFSSQQHASDLNISDLGYSILSISQSRLNLVGRHLCRLLSLHVKYLFADNIVSTWPAPAPSSSSRDQPHRD